MFLGQFEHIVDKKDRLAIPARFRDAFKEGVVLAQGYEKCIVVYPFREYTSMAEKFHGLPETRPSTRRLYRLTFSNAFSCEMDGQGRVVLPETLRTHATITDAVVVVGAGYYLEVWDKENWLTEKAVLAEDGWQIAESIEFAR
ncbi:MAG: division/cell wall cluster transcriptional repressor MraZ [Chloroflexi bacterium]|nr:division/cell wall cluster transcriptional repressor MraZ [Chloroflexota bacterium]